MILTLLSVALLVVIAAQVNIPGGPDTRQRGLNLEETPDQATVGLASTPGAGAGLREQVIGEARWATVRAKSVASMVQAYDTVVVARVVGSDRLMPADVRKRLGVVPGGEHLDASTPPLGHPKEGATPIPEAANRPVLTLYSVEVETAFRGDRAIVGQVLSVSHNGWVEDGISFQSRNDPPPQPGSTYLFFLKYDVDTDWFDCSPFGRLLLSQSGRLEPVDPAWSRLPAVQQLSGRTIQEAGLLIADAGRP